MSHSSHTEDVYHYEEEQERQALLKSLFAPMKAWFQSLPASFQQKYGEFPLFWQELASWQHIKFMQKMYLLVMDMKDAGEAIDLDAIEKKVQDKLNRQSQPPEVIESKEEPAAAVVKKQRRTKWDLAANGEVTKPEEGTRSKRKSRFSAAAPAPPPAPTAPTPAPSLPSFSAAPAPPKELSHEMLQQTFVLQLKLKQVNDGLLTVIQDAARKELDPNRSPSPPPKYDNHGKRMNTREIRMREQLSESRTLLIEELMRINPTFQPPPDYIRSKPIRKIYIPYKEHPTYNFIGLIIGPRGNTQKRMEMETNTHISIRGKGSAKDGRKKNNPMPEDDEELHVHVSGETEDGVERAAKMIRELLVPVADERNEHKQKQLRELALINGVIREEDEYCQVCGEKGHRQYECPQRTKTFKAAGVKCSICGDQSHPTRDCPFKKDAPTNDVSLDKEYSSFISALGDKPAEETTTPAVSEGVTMETVAGTKKQQTVITVKNVIGPNYAAAPAYNYYQQPGAYQYPYGQQYPTAYPGYPPVSGGYPAASYPYAPTQAYSQAPPAGYPPAPPQYAANYYPQQTQPPPPANNNDMDMG